MILSLENVTKKYKHGNIIENASFVLREGDKVALIGPNGCGKTTLLNILVGNENATSGNIVIANNTSIGYVPQELALIDDLTVLQHVQILLNFYQKSLSVEADKIISAYTLDNIRNNLLRQLSLGERRKLSFALLTLQKKNLILLDEIFTSLDPHTYNFIKEKLKTELHDATVIMTGHQPGLFSGIVSKYLFLMHGKY